MMNKEVVALFSKLFEARQISHVFHLQVTAQMGSAAEHSALDKFYNEISEEIDTLIEVYQGQFEIVTGYDIIDVNQDRKNNAVDYFTDLAKFIQDHRYEAIPKEVTHLHNILDEIVTITYHALYRLKNLK